ALEHVDEVVDHPPLTAHHQVEVAQADVEIDHGDFLAATRQPAGEACGGGRLADASLAGGDYDDLTQWSISPKWKPVGSRADPGETQVLAIEPALHGFADQLGRYGFEDAEHAGDGHQLRVEFLAEHSRRRFAARAGERPAAQ